MDFTEALYYGRIAPHERGFYDNEEYKCASRELDESMQALTETLSEEKLKQFEDFWDRMCKFTTVSEFENFRMGFNLGVRMMHDIF